MNWADPRAPSGGRSHLGYGNGNDHGDGEEDTQGGEKGTWQRKRMKNGRRKWMVTEDRKGKEKATQEDKGNGKGNGVFEHTPGEESSQRGG